MPEMENIELVASLYKTPDKRSLTFKNLLISKNLMRDLNNLSLFPIFAQGFFVDSIFKTSRVF